MLRFWARFACISNLIGLRQAGAYVDKTEQMSPLLDDQQAQCLFLRPRRWGKSTLIDTLAQYFYGHKAVFKVCLSACCLPVVSPYQGDLASCWIWT